MGKAARLKQLRRQQPAGTDRLVERVLKGFGDQPVEIVQHRPGEQKMSEVLVDFAQPMLDLARSEEDVQKALSVATIAWNLALLPPQEREEESATGPLARLPAEAQTIVWEMVERKLLHFNKVNRMIMDFDASGEAGKLTLNVVSTLLPLGGADGREGPADRATT
ncbi:MAG: hypothetical protein HYY24_15455 [Verrucomicrobia bacterium]|nr:hypothetical protein [Verrucomicrobiota bacterium]